MVLLVKFLVEIGIENIGKKTSTEIFIVRICNWISPVFTVRELIRFTNEALAVIRQKYIFQ